MKIKRRLNGIALAAGAAAAGLASIAAAQVFPAFPGADGAAGTLTGGRGGQVYRVTSLAGGETDTGFGTIRYGLNDANFGGAPRTIVFDVGGTIYLGGYDSTSRLSLNGHNVTIAGQTAPGGIRIMGGLVKYSPTAGAQYPLGGNTILRNVTIAPGYGSRNFNPDPTAVVRDFPDSSVYDAIDIAGAGLMVDHVTAVYATDETISANEFVTNVSIQYSNISQGQNYPQADAESSGVSYTGHALGSLLQAGSGAKISVHHNLYAHQKGRLPRVGSEVGTGAHNDFRNNVFYNWLGTAGTGAGTQPSFNKFVGNFWRAGNGGDDVSQTNGADGVRGTLDDVGFINSSGGGTVIFNGANSSGTRVYQSGNLKDINKDADANDTTVLDNSDFGSAAFVADSSFLVQYTGVTDSATTAYDRVLNYAGANWWARSAIDQRIVNEVRTGTGKIMAWADDPYNDDPNEGTEWRAMLNAPMQTRPAGYDTDRDGMPNTWEIQHGLNPTSGFFTPDHALDFDNDGYTNLEEYLNEVAAWPAPTPITWAGGNGRYAIQANWNINWQPSRFDEVRLNNGTVTIDAVGQHAGTLSVGAGGAAALNISAGWLFVENSARVFGGSTISMTGGQFAVPLLTVDSGARFITAAGANVTPRVGFVQSAGVIDLADNALVIDYSGATPAASVRSQILSARAGGDWSGNGIGTSLGDAGQFALGYAEAAAVFNLSAGQTQAFRGQVVDADSIIVLFTRYGDANLDRTVNISDFARLASKFGQAGEWLDGDFNYDGTVNISDFALLASNFGLTYASRPAAVPEPAVLILAPLVIALRRRSRS